MTDYAHNAHDVKPGSDVLLRKVQLFFELKQTLSIIDIQALK